MRGTALRALLLAALVAALAGCGGSGGSTELGEVTAADLAIMPLPPSALGDLVEGAEIDPDESGPQDAAAQAEDTSDPDDTAADLKRRGYVAGYDLEWLGGDADAGVLGAGTGVLEFATPEEAQAFVESLFSWDEAHVGEEVEQGVTLEAVETRELDGVGDLAVTATETASFGNTRFTATMVAFTVGQVAGGVSVIRNDDDDLSARTEELANALADRIVAVAAGEVDEEPVPIPKQSGDVVEAGTPDPSLKPLALALDDLPQGAKVIREDFVDSEGDTSFEREFEFATGTKVGTSALAGLESDVERLGSAAEASFLVALIAGMAEGPDFEKMLAEESGSELFEAKGIETRVLPSKGIADETTAVHATFETAFGDFEAVFAYMAAGRVAGQLYAFAPSGRLDPDDVLALARKMAARMRTDG